MLLRTWSGYALKTATWKYKSARYCAFHAALLHFVDRSLGEKKGRQVIGRYPVDIDAVHTVYRRGTWNWASESLRSLGSVYLCTLNHNSDNEHFWYRRTVRDWLLGLYVWCVKHEIQNKHPALRLWSMIKNLPMFDKSASVKKTETKRSLIFFYKILSFFTHSIILWKFSTWQQFRK